MVKFYDNDLSMHICDLFRPFQLGILTLTAIILSAGCEQNNTASVDQIEGQTPAVTSREPSVDRGPAQIQFNIGNQSYFFDVSDHTRDEFEALLHRAEEITQMNTEEFNQLDIIMILHGPDIDWFRQQNYDKNRQLVDLAAKLDAFGIVDFKACETTMDKQGIKLEELPPFIESVPYAPDEMKRLLQGGYLNL